MTGKGQVGATVGARPVEQTKLPLLITEQHQVLAQQSHRLQGPLGHGGVQARVEFIDQRHRLPVVAHQLSARRTRPDAGDAFVSVGLHGVAFGK